jgi:hypothetical protein
MRKATLALIALVLVLPTAGSAITVLQVRAQVDARLDAIWPGIHDLMTTCLVGQEDCYTTWSIGGTGVVGDLCNTVTADSEVCTMAQTDPGVPDDCGVPIGSHTFASYGYTLTTPDIMAYKLNSYSGPGGRGAQICARLKFNGTAYERCHANGPQAAAFTFAWRAIQ